MEPDIFVRIVLRERLCACSDVAPNSFIDSGENRKMKTLEGGRGRLALNPDYTQYKKALLSLGWCPNNLNLSQKVGAFLYCV
jgi:hypothetical protein